MPTTILRQACRPMSKSAILSVFVAAVVYCGAATSVFAQADNTDNTDNVQLSESTMLLYGRVDRAIRDFDGFLRAIEFERPALLGINYFGVSVGGIDAIRDLEEGRGVDPETFAGLYAGYALPEVAEHLNLRKIRTVTGDIKLVIDAVDGRLRYKGTVVRLYSPNRIRELFDRRDTFRIQQERQRLSAVAEYVNRRRGIIGAESSRTDLSEVAEMADRYQAILPLLSDLSAALQGEKGAYSVLPPGNFHFFGLSIGGVDALADLTQNYAIDPETLAAIYAQRISAEHAERLEYRGDGRIVYDGQELRLYSVARLEQCFKIRERLAVQAGH